MVASAVAVMTNLEPEIAMVIAVSGIYVSIPVSELIVSNLYPEVLPIIAAPFAALESK